MLIDGFNNESDEDIEQVIVDALGSNNNYSRLSSPIHEQVKKYVVKCLTVPESSLTKYLRHSFNKIFPGFLEEIKTNPVLEIGPGFNPINKFFDCKDYIGVDLATQSDKYNIINIEAYTFLKTLEDNSRFIVSTGVIDLSIAINIDYLKILGEEIKRVSNGKAILIGPEVELIFGPPTIESGGRRGWGGFYEFDK